MEKHDSAPHPLSRMRFIALTDAIASYHSTAINVYAESPEAISAMVLTMMEMWVACDNYATHFYPTLLEYDTGFPRGALDFLVLPRREDLRRLAGIENYLNKRTINARFKTPAWHWDPESGILQTSFAIRYFDEDEEFQVALADIERLAEEAKATKQAEFRELKALYHRHMRRYDLAPPCRHRGNPNCGCPKCKAHGEASAMRIDVFRHPLPDNIELAKTLVFELKMPEVIARWRDTTLSILAYLGAHAFPTSARVYFLFSHPIIQAHLNRVETWGGRYRLASNKSEPLTSDSQPVSSATEANIWIPHEYQYNLYDTVSAMPLLAGKEKTTQSKAFSYLPTSVPESMRTYALGTSHSLNDVMANLSECPTTLSLDEFKSFGNLRAGIRLQWLNILSQLVTPTLDFSKTRTLSLVLQTANEAGPRTDSDGILRSSHGILGEEVFGMALADALEDAFGRICEAWGNTTAWCTYLSLGTRLLSATNSEKVRRHCLAFLAAVRRQSATASEELRGRIVAVASADEEDRQSRTQQALKMSLICHGTFDVGPQALEEILKDDREAAILIASSIFIDELSRAPPPTSPLPADSQKRNLPEKDAVLDLLLSRWRRLSYEAENTLRARIVDRPGRDTCLDIAIKTKVWAGYIPSGAPWLARGPGFRHLLYSASGDFEFQYNLLMGTFLLNGEPLSGLPHEYLDSTYATMFGKRLISVVPFVAGRMRFEAATPQFGYSPVRLGMVNKELIISAQRCGKVYQLIPRSKLQGDFPPLLVSEYVHWLVEGENRIEFRPLDKVWEPLPVGSETQHRGFILHLAPRGGGEGGRTRHRLEKNGSAYMIDVHSRTASVLSRIFRPIERPSFIHYAADMDGQGHPVLQIDLPRFRTTFSLRQGETKITSNQYRGYAVDGDQHCGAFLGLGSKLMMRSDSLGSRVVFVPDGNVLSVRDGIGHASSWVATGVDRKHIRHDLFQVDSITGQLRDNTTLRSKLVLCYLHAVTSHCVPDPLTGRTGTQEALRILRSSAVASADRLDEDEKDMLTRLASLSPTRYRPTRSLPSMEWGVISSLAQHEAFSLLVGDIIDHVRRCAIFYPPDPNRVDPRILLPLGWNRQSSYRALKRSGVLRGWDPEAGGFANSHDSRYEGRQLAKGDSNGPSAEERVLRDTIVLENPTQYRSRLTSAISNPAQALNAITIALGCATRSNFLKDVPVAKKDRLTKAAASSTVAAAIETPNKPGQDVEPGPGHGFVRGFTTQLLEPPAVALRYRWAPTLAWLRSTDLGSATSGERLEIIMLFAALNFAKEADPRIIQVLLAFVTVPAVRAIPVPVPELELEFTDGASVINKAKLWRIVDELSSTEGGSNSSRRDARAAEYDRLEAVGLLVDWLANQAPTRGVSAVPDAASYLYIGYMPLSKVLERVQPLFQSSHSNWRYEGYLRTVVRKTAAAKVEDSFRVANKAAGDTTREIIVWPQSRQKGFIDLQDLFAQSPAPTLAYPEPRAFDEFLCPAGQHQDDGAVQPQMQELLTRLRMDCAPEKPHQARYVEELEQSFDSLRRERERSPCLVLPTEKVPTLRTELVAYRDVSQQQVGKALAAITSALAQGCTAVAGREKTLAPVRPNVTPVLLLQQLSRRWWVRLPESWRHCIVRFALTLAQLQRAHRLVRGADKNPASTAELVGELRNTGHGRSCVDPMKHPESLLLEVEHGILIRPAQESIANMMRQAPSAGTTGAVMQLNMGEGKSSVILPIVAAALADGEKLVRVIVTKPQFKQMKHILHKTLGGLLGRRVYSVPVSRKLQLGDDGASVVISLYRECLGNGGVLLLQLDHVLSLKLLGIESIVSNRPRMGRTIVSEVRSLQLRCRDIVDEADEIFSPRYELTYAMGLQRPLEYGRSRWQTTQDVLSIVARQVYRRVPIEVRLRSEDAPRQHTMAVFPPPAAIRDATASPAFWDAVVQEISLGVEGVSGAAVHSSESLTRSFTEYISRKHPSAAALDEMEASFLTKANRPHVLLLRGLLCHGILAFALQKRWRVEYGVDPTRSPATKLAVPYRAKDLPSARSEFSHPDLVVLLTCLSYYHQGLTDDELLAAFEHLRKNDQGDFEYSLWVQAVPWIPLPLRYLPAVDLNDRRTCIDELFSLLRHAKPVVDYYLSNCVFPREMKEFPHKLSASSWDLTDANTAGFSGTNDAKHMLPLSLRSENTQPHINASVLNSLLCPENTVQRVIEDGVSVAQSILNFVAAATPRIQVILDVGAQILEYSNLEVARAWLGRTSDKDAEAVVTFSDDEELVVVTRGDRLEPFLSSPYALNMQSCLVYLDEAHTRGTDLRLPDHYRAAVTLGPRLPKDKLVQACMRMRKLGRGQSVIFLVPDEIYRGIARLPCGRPGGGSNEGILEVMDVLRWSISETWHESEKLLGLYFTQGVRYQYHRATWESANGFLFNDKARAFLEDEAQTLERRYSPVSQNAASSLVMDNHVRALNSRTAELRGIQAKCRDFGLLDVGPTNPDGEHEQERENAPETENQRSLERPPPRRAHVPTLHDDLVEFVRSGNLSRDSTAVLPAFETLRFTSAANILDPSVFPKDVLVTVEFAKTLVAEPGSPLLVTDQYHRPVQWVMTARGQGAEKMVMIVPSPWEINELLPIMVQSTAVRLHMYATRPNLSFRPSEDLTHFAIPALPPGWAPPPRELYILNLFAGQLYLHCHSHYVWLCDFLGLPRQMAAAAQDSDLSVEKSAFSTAPPLLFLKALLESIRRDNQDVRRTDMGCIVAGYPLRAVDFDGRASLYQRPDDLWARRDAWMTASDQQHPPDLPSGRTWVPRPNPLWEVFGSAHSMQQAAVPPTSNQRRDSISLPPPLEAAVVQETKDAQGTMLPAPKPSKNSIAGIQGPLHPVNHEKDLQSSGGDEVCRRCKCSLCHSEPDMPSSLTHSTVLRWTMRLEAVQKSAQQCVSCKMLYQIVRHVRSHAKAAMAVQLEYNSRYGSEGQMFLRLIDDGGRRSEAHELYNTCSETYFIYKSPAPWRGIPQRPRAAAITRLSAAANWIESRLWLCKVDHKGCRPADPERRAPTRLLDLGDWETRKSTRAPAAYLRLTAEMSGKITYAVLAIDEDPKKARQFGATRPNVNHLMTLGLDFDALPAPYRDAIKLSRRLGIRYLWADALCVLQDDESDLRREHRRRPEIYLHAHLTFLAGPACGGTAGGLLSLPTAAHQRAHKTYPDGYLAHLQALRASADAAEPLPPCGPVYVRRAPQHHHYPYHAHYYHFDRQDRDLDPCTAASAWAYQAAILSPRLVCFADNELHWECGASHITCECGGAGQLPSTAAPRSVRALLRHRLQKGWQGRYLAGLREDALQLDLSWRECEPRAPLPVHTVDGGIEGEDAIVPSWSWMAARRPAYGDGDGIEPLAAEVDAEEGEVVPQATPASKFQVVAARCTSWPGLDAEPVSPLAPPYLVLSGELASVRLQLVTTELHETNQESSQQVLPRQVWVTILGLTNSEARVHLDYIPSTEDVFFTENARIDSRAPVTTNGDDGISHGSAASAQIKVMRELAGSFYVFRLLETTALLLKKLGHDSGVYRRIGLVSSLSSVDVWMNDQVIQIV